MYSIIVASLNENVKLAYSLKSQLDALGKESEIINLVELDLPMYTSKKEEEGIPRDVLTLVQGLKSSKGYIIIAPEYNYTIPPVLTNAIAWISRVGNDFKECFHDKTILLATHSGGGGTDVLKDMRNQLAKLGAKVHDTEILTTYKKPLDINLSKKILENFIQL